MNNNWIVSPVMNNLQLTKNMIRTALAQTVGDIRLFIINNGSTDGTAPWLYSKSDQIHSIHNYPAASVSTSWNLALKYLFSFSSVDRVLVVNNDILLPRFMFEVLRDQDLPFVTGVGSNDKDCVLMGKPENIVYRPHPDFSCFMIRRDCWEEVGIFDECFIGAFCEDLDYHIRMHKAGIDAVSINVPFYHFGSATIKLANSILAKQISDNAARNRIYFERKWGVPVPNPENEGKEYYDLFRRN